MTSATVVELRLDADPPRLVAELIPGGRRLVLDAGESHRTMAPERVRRVDMPAGVDRPARNRRGPPCRAAVSLAATLRDDGRRR